MSSVTDTQRPVRFTCRQLTQAHYHHAASRICSFSWAITSTTKRSRCSLSGCDRRRRSPTRPPTPKRGSSPDLAELDGEMEQIRDPLLTRLHLDEELFHRPRVRRNHICRNLRKTQRQKICGEVREYGRSGTRDPLSDHQLHDLWRSHRGAAERDRGWREQVGMCSRLNQEVSGSSIGEQTKEQGGAAPPKDQSGQKPDGCIAAEELQREFYSCTSFAASATSHPLPTSLSVSTVLTRQSQRTISSENCVLVVGISRVPVRSGVVTVGRCWLAMTRLLDRSSLPLPFSATSMKLGSLGPSAGRRAARSIRHSTKVLFHFGVPNLGTQTPNTKPKASRLGLDPKAGKKCTSCGGGTQGPRFQGRQGGGVCSS